MDVITLNISKEQPNSDFIGNLVYFMHIQKYSKKSLKNILGMFSQLTTKAKKNKKRKSKKKT